MRSRIIGYTICSTVLLGNRVLISSGLLKGDISEPGQRLRFRCCRGGRFRHRCVFGHCCQIKCEALCLAPIIKLLGCFQMSFHRFVGVGDGQAFFTVIRHKCIQFIRSCINRFRSNPYLYLMRSCIVGNSIRAFVNLGDGIFVDSFFLKGNLTEFSQSCILGSCRGSIFRHRCILGHSCQLKGKAFCLAPVVKGLGYFQRFLNRCEGVGDDQAVLAIVSHFFYQVVSVFCNGNDYLVSPCVIRHTRHLVVNLSDRVLVFSGLLIFHFTEDCCRFCFGCNGRRVLRQRCAVNCSQIESETLSLAPVTEIVGGL